jgi:hypothetical protein
MAGLDVLTPTAPDPNARLYERLASLEARLAAVERQRDMWVTVVDLLHSNAPSSFSTHGGKLWIVHGGVVRTPDSLLGKYVLNVDGGEVDQSNTVDTVSNNTDHPTGVNSVQLTGYAAGSHTIDIDNYVSGGVWTTSYSEATALIFEFPV